MDEQAVCTVADSILPLLVTLVRSRKQARWQWKHCAGESKHKWRMVLIRLDQRIVKGEKAMSERMGLLGFRVKREIAE